MASVDTIEFSLEEESYKDHINSYQRKTGLTKAVQTGTGQLNSIPIAIGVMDFYFMGGSMGSIVGKKITCLIKYATNRFLPLILVSTPFYSMLKSCFAFSFLHHELLKCDS